MGSFLFVLKHTNSELSLYYRMVLTWGVVEVDEAIVVVLCFLYCVCDLWDDRGHVFMACNVCRGHQNRDLCSVVCVRASECVPKRVCA